MLSADFNRRELLRAAGIAGVVAVTTIRLPGAAAAIMPVGSHPFAAFAARVHLEPDGSALITVAASRMDEALQVVWEPAETDGHYPIGSVDASPWDRRQQAYETARGLLVAMAARNWEVEPDECRAQYGQIIHQPSGRAANYLIWTDFG